jgi:hypothetical protein
MPSYSALLSPLPKLSGGWGLDPNKTTEKNVGIFKFILSTATNMRGRQTLKVKEHKRLFYFRRENVGFFVFEKLPSSTLVTVSQLWVEYREKKDPLLKELLKIIKVIISITFYFTGILKSF